MDGAEPVEVKVRSVYRSQLHYVVMAENLDLEKVHTITVIPEKSRRDGKAVMRWGAILLNSDRDIDFRFDC